MDIKPIKFYTTKDLQVLFGITDKHAQKMVREGRIKAIKIGNEWKITEEHLQEFLDSAQNRPDKNKAE